MTFVYTGKYIRIDLTTGAQRVETIPAEDVRRYYLGSGFAAGLYYAEMDPALAPLDARSPLYVFNGLLSGTFAPTGCRSSWCGRSPLTGIWDESNVGGHWGAELRAAGVDGLVLTGRAEAPVYLYVHDGTAEVRDARHLWGLDTYDAYDRLIAETDPKARAAVIGPAGEHLVHFAAIMQGGRGHSRAAGRGGMGALLGSKRVKAIVVRGKERPEYADPAAFRERVKADNAHIKEQTLPMATFGTAGGVMGAEAKGALPIRNWQGGSWAEGAKRTSGQTLHTTIWVKQAFCHACPIGCGQQVDVKEGPYAGVRGEGPEYEALCGFGAQLEIDDLAAVVRSNDLCNRYGLDTISTSGTLAFAFEAFERGLISLEEIEGVPLAWGQAAGAHKLIELISYRRGAGAYLADGVRAAAAHLGRGAEAFAVHVKGMEVPYHDPRAFAPMAINFATSSRGACHLEAPAYWRAYGTEFPGWQTGPHDRFATEGAADLAVAFQNFFATFSPLGVCKFIGKSGFAPDDMARLLGPALGWGLTGEEVVQTGERLFTLKRLINNRLGVTRADDTLPLRLRTQPRPEGGAAGYLPDLERLLADYYQLRGWLPDGRPEPQRVAGLGLEA